MNTTHPNRSPPLFVIIPSPKTHEIIAKQLEAKAQISQESKERTSSEFSEVYENLPASLRRVIDLATEKGASTWQPRRELQPG